MCKLGRSGKAVEGWMFVDNITIYNNNTISYDVAMKLILWLGVITT